MLATLTSIDWTDVILDVRDDPDGVIGIGHIGRHSHNLIGAGGDLRSNGRYMHSSYKPKTPVSQLIRTSMLPDGSVNVHPSV